MHIQEGDICRASNEGDEYDGVLIKIIDLYLDDEEPPEDILIEVLSTGFQGHWSFDCVIPLSPLEQLAREAEK